MLIKLQHKKKQY